jgi:hypothetical protein
MVKNQHQRPPQAQSVFMKHVPPAKSRLRHQHHLKSSQFLQIPVISPRPIHATCVPFANLTGSTGVPQSSYKFSVEIPQHLCEFLVSYRTVMTSMNRHGIENGQSDSDKTGVSFATVIHSEMKLPFTFHSRREAVC